LPLDAGALQDIIHGRKRLQSLAEVRSDRVAAHASLFPHLHKFATCPAQEDAIRKFHDSHPRRIEKAFRGFAKSTRAEEGLIIKGALGEFTYAFVLGNTYGMAVKRLALIKAEINSNRRLMDVFGDLRGKLWQEGFIELSTGPVIQAVGARQSLRGAKERERPDFVVIDDLEDPEWVRDPDAIESNKIWFMAEFLPALADPLRTPIRWLGTPLDENCLLNQFGRSEGWEESVYPIKYRDPESGEWRATWPEKHPLADIDVMEQTYVSIGNHREFVQEYMCESESRSEVLFRKDMFRYVPAEARPRTWQALYGMVDPARTTKKNSAMTGWAVWSWEAGGRLTIWEASGAFLKPDEVVSLLFDLHGRWNLVDLGIEEDGLNEWAMQPIRDMQLKRGVIPVRAMRAPRGKLDFIRGLQPYFSATSTVMVGGEADFRNLTNQLLAFPRDLMDVPNALAYALIMRPGEVVYPDFSYEHIIEDAGVIPGEMLYLALNADGARCTAALIQYSWGVPQVLADWVAEGPALDMAGELVRQAVRYAGRKVVPVVGPVHGETYRNFGLVAAIVRACGQAPVFGVKAEAGRAELRAALQRRVRGGPGFAVSSEAVWTLRGMTGGYCLPTGKGGVMGDEAQKGVYRTLIEGIEVVIGLAVLATQADDAPGSFRVTDDGRRYRSALRR
jgi:hypothetical protein